MTTQVAEKPVEKSGVQSSALVDKYHPQLYDFDQAVVYEEQPVQKKITLELYDVQQQPISVETSLLHSATLRIVCSKHPLIVEKNTLWMDMQELHAKLKHAYLLKIPCVITQVEHFKHVTHAVLEFGADADAELMQWYSAWLEKLRQSNKSKEIEENAYNFIFQYYKRLYSTHLTYPVLFSANHKIKKAFCSKQSRDSYTFVDAENRPSLIPTNIIQPYIKQHAKNSRTPLYIWCEDDHVHYFTNAEQAQLSPKKIIAWLRNKPQWRVLLVRNRDTVSADALQLDEIKGYVTQETLNHSHGLEQIYHQVDTTTNIIDISCLFQQIRLPEYTQEIKANSAPLREINVSYQFPSFSLKRSEPRFAYITGVKLRREGKEGPIALATQTVDISFLGLNIEIPDEADCFKMADKVQVEFTQWNKDLSGSMFKKKETLSAVKYEVINIDRSEDKIHLGVTRVKREAQAKFNKTIQEVIDELKNTGTEGVLNNLDLYRSLLASLWINNNIAGLLFFLGRDQEGIRIIQAIANTRENLKIRIPYAEQNDWTFLQNIAASLGVAVNSISADKNNVYKQMNLGVYCYYDAKAATPRWYSQTDLDFKTEDSKREFIRTAIAFPKHYFYHCSLIPVKSGKDDILNNDSSAFVSISPSRLKEIHEVCRSLIAVGELNDVTRLIEYLYK